MAIEKQIVLKADTGEAVKNIKKTTVELNKTNEATTTLDKNLDNLTGGAVSKFKGFVGGLKSIATGFKGVGAAIATTGLGLLVITIGSLVAAFKSSEEGQNKFAKLTGMIGAVVGNLVDLLADLGDALITAVTEPQKAWNALVSAFTKGFQIINDQVITRFKSGFTLLTGDVEKGILKMRIAWNEFTGDAEEAESLKIELKAVEDQMIKAQEEINRVNGVIIDGFNDAIDKVKEFAAENIKEAKLAAQVADMRAKADKLDRQLLVERATLENQIAELRLKSRQEEEFTANQRAQFIKDAQVLEDQLLSKETEALQLRAEAIALENTFARSTKENLDAEAEASAAVIRQQAARTNAARATQRELNRLNKEVRANENAAFKERQTEIDALEKAEQDRINSILKAEQDFAKKIEDLNAKTEEDKLALERQRAQEQLNLLIGTEEEKRQAKLELDAFYNQRELELEQQRILEREALEKQFREKALDEQTKYAQALVEADENIAQAKRDALMVGLNALQQFAGENKALAVAILGIQKALAIAEIITNAKKGIAVSLSNWQSVPPFIGSFPNPAYVKAGILHGKHVATTKLTAGASIASILAQSVTSIKGASGLGGQSGAGGAGSIGGGGSASPAFNIVGTSGVNQIAETLNQETEPVQAFVVGSNVTTQQEMDRNIVNTATLG